MKIDSIFSLWSMGFLFLCSSIYQPSFAQTHNSSLSSHNAIETALTQNVNLDYLKLTPEEVTKRDNTIATDLSKFYDSATESRYAQLLEKNFGIQIYHKVDTLAYSPSLSNFTGIMDSIIRYYTGFESESPFNGASEDVIPKKQILSCNYNKSDAFMLQTWMHYEYETDRHGYYKDDKNGNRIVKNSSVQTNTDLPIFKVPVFDRFLKAMTESHLKGLDATVVFMNGKLCVKEEGDTNSHGSDILVTYPEFSDLAPIPHPIIFVSSTAKQDEILSLINTQAPLIYAYNKLFEQRVLPTVDEMGRVLSKFPETLKVVEESIRKSNQENSRLAEARVRRKVFNLFLKANYVSLTLAAGPLSLLQLVANPSFADKMIDYISSDTVRFSDISDQE